MYLDVNDSAFPHIYQSPDRGAGEADARRGYPIVRVISHMWAGMRISVQPVVAGL